VFAIQRAYRADRQAHAMQRQRIKLADRRKITMRRPARAHVIFGMNLEKADIRGGFKHCAPMFGAQPDTAARRKRQPCWLERNIRHGFAFLKAASDWRRSGQARPPKGIRRGA
jgi:hypothetical protein